jgi:threonine aldolase
LANVVSGSKIQSLSGSNPIDLAGFLQQISVWCKDNNVDFDNYGEGELIAGFEAKIATLLGFPAARFMPSGVLAQLIALKIWCNEAGSSHFGMHPTSHLELHEEHAYSHLYNLRATLLGPKDSPLLAEHLVNLDQDMAALLTELPIREVGGQLPSWRDLKELVAECKKQGIRLHMDGARLWEAQPFYSRDYREICQGFDSVYVSFYKGIGALPGAMLLGSEDFIDQAKRWQRRAGGTIQTLGPQVASAAMLFDKRVASMSGFWERAKSLAAVVQSIPLIKCVPSEPQVNMMHIILPFSVDCAEAARDKIAEMERIRLFGRALKMGETESYFELTIGGNLLGIPDEQVAELFERFMIAGQQWALAHG